MAVSAFDDWFSVSIRRNRASFVIANGALFATLAVCIFGWFYFAESARSRQIGLFIFGLPAVACSYLLVSQRLRDINVSGWLTLLWIPINVLEGQLRVALTLAAIIILCAVPGTKGPNKYGDDPLG